MSANGHRPTIGWRMLTAVAAAVCIYLVLPIFVVVPISFSAGTYLQFPPAGWSTRWYRAYLESPDWVDATVNSFLIAGPTAVLSVVLGTAGALGLVRGRFTGRRAFTALVLAPMVIPHIILAIGLYPVLGDLSLTNTHVGVIIGHTVLAVPLVVVTVSAALRGVDISLEHAAMSLGARPFRTFWYVTFPLIRPAVVAGGLFAFLASFDELLVALFISGTDARTLPRVLWQAMQFELTPVVAAASTIVVAFSLTLLAVVQLLRRQVVGRSVPEVDV